MGGPVQRSNLRLWDEYWVLLDSGQLGSWNHKQMFGRGSPCTNPRTAAPLFPIRIGAFYLET